MTVGRRGRSLGLAAAAGLVLIGGAAPVAAECTFIPPMPKVSFAVAHGARQIFVGTVVDGGDRRGFRVRVEEVLRGDARVGTVRIVQRLDTNWPWSISPGGGPYPGCISLHGRPGDHVIVLLDARFPGGWLTENGQRWYQPPTTFHTIGVVAGSPKEPFSGGRQQFSLERLRAMVAGLPATDTGSAPVARSSSPVAPLVIVLAGFVAGALAVRRHWSPR